MTDTRSSHFRRRRGSGDTPDLTAADLGGGTSAAPGSRLVPETRSERVGGRAPARKAAPAGGDAPEGDAARMRAVAEAYVASRECSAEMLRRVLMRAAMRRIRGLTEDAAAPRRAALEAASEAEIARLVAAGLVCDARFAEMRARQGRAAGRGQRRIMADLARAGVEAEIAADALREVDAAGEMARPEDAIETGDWEAAMRFAQKRRIGAFRPRPLPEAPAERARVVRRELGALARAGFQADLAREIIARDGAVLDGHWPDTH